MCLMVLHKNKTAITSDKDSMIPKIQSELSILGLFASIS